MSRPRKPYGPNPPGRLYATMIKVLAAELSDQGRLSRGKRYWADDAVIDIVVGHGAATAEIQGSRPEPYIVTLEAAGGSGVPTKRELWVQCTCPDDVGTGLDACKHAVAALFALSDEVAIEPELIDRWRASRRPGRDVGDATVTELHRATPSPTHDGARSGGAEPDDDVDDRDDGDGDDDDGDDDDGDDAEIIELHPQRRDPALDAISVLLQAPGGAAPPVFFDPTPVTHPPIRERIVNQVLEDALDHLAIRWE